MDPTSRRPAPDATADPFGEGPRASRSLHKQILGGNFHFESTSDDLLDLVEAAYGDLPAHRFAAAAPGFHIELRLVPRPGSPAPGEPPPVQMQSGAGLLCGVMDASNYVILAPGQGGALVVASEDMLSHPYHVRYELLEFAVFTLATRGLGLVPLHAACVGRHGRGILLLGSSGSGKSTLALHSLLRGLDFLSEDAVFVQPDGLLASGVANYLHVQPDALRFVDDAGVREWIERAPVIRRRSGVEKLEADLRRGQGQLAPAPLELAGAVFVSGQWADDPDALLSPVAEADVLPLLAADQPYAAGQPGWDGFARQLTQRGVHHLRRGRHPQSSVDALLQLLG